MVVSPWWLVRGDDDGDDQEDDVGSHDVCDDGDDGVGDGIHGTSGGSVSTWYMGMGTQDVTTSYSNTLTLLNTNLLLASGVLSVGSVHAVGMKLPVLANSSMLLVMVLGTLFLSVQCCEYIHLH